MGARENKCQIIHNNCENSIGKILNISCMRKVSFYEIRHFSHKKFSLELLQITNYIYIALEKYKKKKGMRCCLIYSSTMF